MPRYLHYLRLTWTVCCGLACGLLIVLWVRSYWATIDGVSYYGVEDAFSIASWKGVLMLERSMDDPYRPKGLGLCLLKNDPSFVANVEPRMPDNILGFAAKFGSRPSARNWSVLVPYWFGVLLVAMLASVPWLPWWSPRFSVRTLLIATTLIAVVLGLTIAAQRWSAAGKANALKAARQWMSDQGRDPSAGEFNAEADGTGWQVLIEYQPPTPGAHTLLRIDSQFKVIEVIPGL